MRTVRPLTTWSVRVRLTTATSLVALGFGLGGCSGQGTAGYREAAHTAVGAALSETRTAQLTLEAYRGGRATSAYTVVVVKASDAALGGAAGSFAAEDPPTPDLDALREQLLDNIGSAQEAVAAARIALTRGDDTAQSLADLRRAGDTLAEDLEALS